MPPRLHRNGIVNALSTHRFRPKRRSSTFNFVTISVLASDGSDFAREEDDPTATPPTLRPTTHTTNTIRQRHHHPLPN
eukprot:scaffold4881_cov42-Cyclotella_meneghiniana.AAC.3